MRSAEALHRRRGRISDSTAGNRQNKKKDCHANSKFKTVLRYQCDETNSQEPLVPEQKCWLETSAPSRLQLGSWDSLLTSDFQRVLHCLHDCLDFQRVLHCLHDCLSGGTKRRSSWACIGNPNPEQETSKGTHAQETSANQRRPTTQHAAQGSNPPIGARLFKWRVLAQC